MGRNAITPRSSPAAAAFAVAAALLIVCSALRPAAAQADGECWPGNVPCPGGTGCVRADKLCDGVFDCEDGSDDGYDFCLSYDCSSVGKVRVRGPVRGNRGARRGVGWAKWGGECDDASDDGSDDGSVGKVGTWCREGYQCRPVSGYCDLNNDCMDGSDEEPEQCYPIYKDMRKDLCAAKGLLSNGSDEEPEQCYPYYKDLHKDLCAAKGLATVSALRRCATASRSARTGGTSSTASTATSLPLLSSSAPTPFQVRCPNDPGYCIGPQDVCDSIPQCSDGWDELDCFDHTCQPGQIHCPITGYCATGRLCDGTPDCFGEMGEEDENPDFCQGYACPAGWKKCADGLQCVEASRWCDGAVNCLDGSDEGAVCVVPPPPPPPTAGGSGTSSGGSSGGSNSSSAPVVLSKEEIAKLKKLAREKKAAVVAAKKQKMEAKRAAEEEKTKQRAAKNAAIEAKIRAKEEKKAAVAAKKAAVEAKKKQQADKEAAIAEKKRKQAEKAAAIEAEKKKEAEKKAAIEPKKKKQAEKAAAIAEKKRKQAEKAAAIEAKKRKQSEKTAAIAAKNKATTK
ncbi:unnamed protein product [Closterium sp. Naga37s-1]|nr:unnamed protein product [Closterium sp. Naga37s-1]